jgi:hypothetical protein
MQTTAELNPPSVAVPHQIPNNLGGLPESSRVQANPTKKAIMQQLQTMPALPESLAYLSAFNGVICCDE